MFNRIAGTDLPAPVDTIDPADLIPLAELASEGFGWDGPYVTGPRSAVDALAAQLADQVTIDDLGRRAVPRQVACELFAERTEAEQRQREVQQRNEAQLAEQAAANVPRPGVSADQIPDGVLPAAAMLQAAKDNEPRRVSPLEEALANDDSVTYHPIDREAS